MIKLELYPLDKEQVCVAVINHRLGGVTASIHWNYKSRQDIRRYLCGLEPPNYPVPAIALTVEYCEGFGPFPDSLHIYPCSFQQEQDRPELTKVYCKEERYYRK